MTPLTVEELAKLLEGWWDGDTSSETLAEALLPRLERGGVPKPNAGDEHGPVTEAELDAARVRLAPSEPSAAAIEVGPAIRAAFDALDAARRELGAAVGRFIGRAQERTALPWNEPSEMFVKALAQAMEARPFQPFGKDVDLHALDYVLRQAARAVDAVGPVSDVNISTYKEHTMNNTNQTRAEAVRDFVGVLSGYQERIQVVSFDSEGRIVSIAFSPLGPRQGEEKPK